MGTPGLERLQDDCSPDPSGEPVLADESQLHVVHASDLVGEAGEQSGVRSIQPKQELAVFRRRSAGTFPRHLDQVARVRDRDMRSAAQSMLTLGRVNDPHGP
jgi:hypothetical protein